MLFRPTSFRVLGGGLLAVLGLAGLMGCLTGCNEATDTSTTTDDEFSSSTAALLLRPSEFIGDTPCSAAPGAMRSYVATLIDHVEVTTTDPETGEETVAGYPFTFSSSLPTPCSKGVRFDEVVGALEGTFHRYSVQIDGYEAFADELWPQGAILANGDVDYKALRSGTRVMQTADGTLAQPRWLGSCGEGEEEPTLPNAAGTTLITGCSPLVDLNAGQPQKTAVVVDPRDTLGSLPCAESAAAGQPAVASFDLVSSDGFAPINNLACTQSADISLEYTGDNLVPGEGLEFYVAAHEAPGGPVVWGALCSALVKEGLTVRAACSPLTGSGSLRIDITGLLEKLGVTCSGDITSYDVTLSNGDALLEKAGVSCAVSTSFAPLAPGDATANVTVRTKDGESLFSAECGGTVEPGRSTTADCILQ